MLACSAGGFWWGEWIYISIGCSGRHLDIVKSWGEVKNLPSVGERKKNWGRGRGRGKKNLFFSPPRPPPLRHSVILAPILPVCSESKIAANHSIDLQNRLHCRLTLCRLLPLFSSSYSDRVKVNCIKRSRQNFSRIENQ